MDEGLGRPCLFTNRGGSPVSPPCTYSFPSLGNWELFPCGTNRKPMHRSAHSLDHCVALQADPRGGPTGRPARACSIPQGARCLLVHLPCFACEEPGTQPGEMTQPWSYCQSWWHRIRIQASQLIPLASSTLCPQLPKDICVLASFNCLGPCPELRNYAPVE